MMKYLALILLLNCIALGHVDAQKTKIKEEGTNSNPDSVKADGIGKAAIRGGNLMESARDSLRGADLRPPSDIVDTFGIQEARPREKSYLRRNEIYDVDKRLAAAKVVAEQATFDLELAKTNPKITPKQIEEAESMLQYLQKYLDDLEAKLIVLKYDWEETTGARLDAGIEAPKTNNAQGVPKTPAKPGAKDAIKGGKGK